MTDKPTPTDPEIRGVAATEAGMYQDDCASTWYANDSALMAFARAVLAKWGSPSQAAEPVAWVWRFSDGSFCETPFETQKACAQDSIGYEGEPVPLYLALQPVAREPISNFHAADEFTAEPHTDDVFAAYQQGIRFAERHHDIKGGQHGTDSHP